jgi:hypothetical protein
VVNQTKIGNSAQKGRLQNTTRSRELRWTTSESCGIQEELAPSRGGNADDEDSSEGAGEAAGSGIDTIDENLGAEDLNADATSCSDWFGRGEVGSDAVGGVLQDIPDSNPGERDQVAFKGWEGSKASILPQCGSGERWRAVVRPSKIDGGKEHDKPK